MLVGKMSSWFLSVVSSDGMHQSSPADTRSFHFHKLTVPPFLLLRVPARGTGTGKTSLITEHLLGYRED